MPNYPVPPPPTRTGAAVASKAAKQKVPVLPVIEKIMNDIIHLDPGYYLEKRYEDIIEAASELPTVIEYINESLQRASIHSMNAKFDVESLEAETYNRLRQEWSSTFTEKMTEKALEMAIAVDQELLAARQNYSVLKSYVSRLANMQENVRSKLDILRSVEATRRKLIADDANDDR